MSHHAHHRHANHHSHNANHQQQQQQQQQQQSASLQSCTEVYAPDTKTLYSVPKEFISHMGLPSDKGRLLVCRTYCNAIEAGERPGDVTSCAMGNQCRFVHIDVPLTQLKGDVIHVHYVYRSEGCCAYESLSAAMNREHSDVPSEVIEGFSLMIYGPNNREPVERIPTTRLLLTGGSRYAFECATNPRRTAAGQVAEQPRVCHCAHYYFTQTCNRGANCSFIHVISVDPSQKADSIKPANYRRRVVQLGQPEVPQAGIAMGTPQVQYHSNAPSVQTTPAVGQHHHHGDAPHSQRHMSISIGMNNALSPNTFNQGTPVTVGHAPARVPTIPSPVGLGQDACLAPHAGESNNNSTTAYNGYHRNAHPSPAGTSEGIANGYCSSSTYNNSYSQANSALPPPPPSGTGMATVGNVPTRSAHNSPATYANTSAKAASNIPPPPTGSTTSSPVAVGYGAGPQPRHIPASASTSAMTAMLPMDDVVDGCYDAAPHAGPYGAGQYHSNYANTHSRALPAGLYINTPTAGYGYNGQQHSGSFSLNNNAADAMYSPAVVPPGYSSTAGYANSAQCSPTGTPSTAMHKVATPKVAAGRFAHNPYAQSPVTAQASV